MKKKIAFYYDIFFLGGVEHAILTLIKQLHKNYEIYVIYGNENPNKEMLEKYSPYSTVISLKTANIDVDFCICASDMNVDEFIQKIRAKKYYAWIHAIMFQTYPNANYSLEYRETMDKFICVSDAVQEDILSVYPELANKCITIKNYIDIDEIITKSENTSCDLKVDKSKLNIITVARLSEEKGFHRIKAIIDLFNKNNINYNWYILGAAYTKETDNKIKNIFSKNDHITFLGYKENPYVYIKQMNFLALLSDIEAWGLVVSEALVLKVPCIVTDFKEAHSQINNSNGIIIPMNTNEYEKYVPIICNSKFNIRNTDLIAARNTKILLAWGEIL